MPIDESEAAHFAGYRAGPKCGLRVLYYRERTLCRSSSPELIKVNIGEDLGDLFELLSDVVLFGFPLLVCAVESSQAHGDVFLLLSE